MAEWMSIVRMLYQLLIMKYANDHNQVSNWSAQTRVDGDIVHKNVAKEEVNGKW